MPKGAEKSQAQPECAKMFNHLGWAHKVATEAFCDRCHKVIYPKHTGAPDYLAILRNPTGDPKILGIEVKGTYSKRWAFADWKPEQREWPEKWGRIINSTQNHYLWIQMGPDNVNSKSEFRRKTFLVPRQTVLNTEAFLLEKGVKSIPMNLEARSKGTDDMNNLHIASVIWGDYMLDWIPTWGWWPKPHSSLWEKFGVPYTTYPDTAHFMTNRPN
jgi:hypothetical protein